MRLKAARSGRDKFDGPGDPLELRETLGEKGVRMRRPDAFNSFKSEDMTSPSQSLNIGVDPQLNHMMKIINSPANRKLPVVMGKTFGVPLAELVARQAGRPVIPTCVKRICEYIENNGIQREGIFRVSGNTKTVENLKTLFDQLGDANLEETGDVMASAALLKLFFRELPEAVIPDKLNASFVQVIEENSHDAEECVCQLKQLVEQLPEEHFNTLRYLMAFLVRVADSEEHNRMSSSALGIVFGPSLFRVSEDLDGLHRQTIANQIVTKFIKHFSAIFEADSEAPVSNIETNKVKQATPPVDMKGSGIRPNDVLSLDSEIDELYKSDGSQPSSPSQNDTTPTDFDDSSDQGSTATSLDSDSEISTPESELSPAVSDVATEFVEMTISNTVSERLFGPDTSEPCKDCSKATSEQTSGRLNEHQVVVDDEKDAGHSGQKHCPVPTVASTSNDLTSTNVANKGSDHSTTLANSSSSANSVSKEASSHHSQIPTHLPASNQGSEHTPNLAPPATPDVKRREWSFKFDDDYHEIKRSLERSQVFQRSPLSKGRRIRKCVRKSYSLDDLKDEDYTDEDSLKENEDHEQVECHLSRQQQQHKSSGSQRKCAKDVGTSHSLDVDPDRPSHPFLELHPQQPQAKEWNSESLSQSPSPNASRKPFVPPLDLTILHEHCDGNEPIPMNHLRASWPMARPDREDDHVMVSPRTSQLKKKGSASSDPNIPPSPPVEQDAFHKMSIREDEATTLSIKQLNKRIYSMKRKIKHFEEKFEDEYGYRPSHSEKMARSEIKKYMTELSKARKDLKQMKEDALQAGLMHLTSGGSSADASQLPCGTSSGLDETGPPHDAHSDERSAMEELLGEMLQLLSEKRRLAKRPEELKDMDTDQVHEEKVAIQKSLLQFESTFGRPTTKPEKELMRPIYDRYRSVKRMLSKLASPLAKDPGTELQPILEHEAMDFVQASPLHRPGGNEEDSTDEPCDHSVSDRVENQADVPDLKKVKKSHNACNLHELTLPELLEQQRRVKEEKKRLRRVLREFEGEFQRQTGRRVQREDRTPLEAIYGEYKQVKAKLRLLEALLSKHDCHYTI